MGLIKSMYGEEAENQVAWSAFIGAGGSTYLVLMILHIKIEKFIKSIRRNNGKYN